MVLFIFQVLLIFGKLFVVKSNWFCSFYPLLVSLYNVLVMNHDSGFIIGIAQVFAKILIEHTAKTHLINHPSI